MKKKSPQELFSESLRELAQSKSVDKITIREIAENCGYSPATFYRYFHDKYDLIVWDYARHTSEIMDRVGRNGYVWVRSIIDGVLLYFQNDRQYLKNLSLNTKGGDSFVSHLIEAHVKLLSEQIQKSASAKALDQDARTLIRVYCAGTVIVLYEWLTGTFETTPEGLAKTFERALPEPLSRYLRPK